MNEIIERLNEEELDTIRSIANSKSIDKETTKELIRTVLLKYSMADDNLGCAIVDYAFRSIANELYEMLKESNN